VAVRDAGHERPAAIVACVLAGLSLAGRYEGATVQWVVFGIDELVCVAAAVFFTVFRVGRLL
jgi:hypothetical protein